MRWGRLIGAGIGFATGGIIGTHWRSYRFVVRQRNGYHGKFLIKFAIYATTATNVAKRLLHFTTRAYGCGNESRWCC